jgi:serine O-acetyltransferase
LFGSADPDWLADISRAGGRRALLREQSLWAIWIYRFGRRVDRRRDTAWKKCLLFYYWCLFRLVETATGISLPKSSTIGKGLRIWHFGGIFIHKSAVIGENCTLRQGVTIGNRIDDDDAPILGNDVQIGAYAQLLGKIRVGDGCKIGALTVVLHDLPDGATVVGQPARLLPRA